MENILNDFFSYSKEKGYNHNILFYRYSKNEIMKYIDLIVNEPINSYITFILEMERKIISPRDIYQFSSFSDATTEICKKLEMKNNPGMKFCQIGEMLLNDGIERKQGAYTKYGENHIKTATSLGLCFEFNTTYYLSGIGYGFNKLNDREKKKLLTRLILRSTLISRMYQASKNEEINVRELLYMISDSTYKRRKSNIKSVIKILRESDEFDFVNFTNKLQF